MSKEYAMDALKTRGVVELRHTTGALSTIDDALVDEKCGTMRDEVDMDRMGKVQVLRVRISYTHTL